MSKEGEREVRANMGLAPGGELREGAGLGEDAMLTVMNRMREDEATRKKRDRKNPSGRKRGGQPGNQNGAGRQGLYSRNVEGFEKRFKHYSRALGKIDSQDEVALTRAMMINLLSGKDPMGCGEIEDEEVLNSYARDVLMLNLKAQELFLKQQAKAQEMEEKKGAKAGIEIKMSAEMEQAMSGMKAAQRAAAEEEQQAPPGAEVQQTDVRPDA